MAGQDFDRAAVAAALDAGLAQLDIDLDENQRRQLLDYLQLLHKWNRTYNLTAVRDPLQMVAKHVLDSLVIAPYVPGKTLIDVGTGAGIPGIPLAIARPDLDVTMLDSNGKKTRFVAQAIRQLGLANAQVIKSRLEDYQPPQGFDGMTSRAFASLRQMLEWGGPLCNAEGTILAMKGRYPGEEIDDLPADYEVESVQDLRVPGLDSERHLVLIRHRN